MRMLSIGLMLTIVGSVQAQTDSTKTLEEAVIYTNKFREKLQNTAQQAIVLTARGIAKVNAGVTGDLLSESGQVFVQKSQQGGSSPVLRGFEASRVLLLVDGIRMNNAIYRAGHLQNAVTIDQNMLESVEVLFGPGSTLHGSDALGGVINFRTKQANLSSTNKLETSGNSFFRYRTVNHEITGHQLLTGAQNGRFQIVRNFLWLQNGQIFVGLDTDHKRIGFCAIEKSDAQFFGAGNHMKIGQYRAIVLDDYTSA